jgi:arginase family enzyme
MAFHTVIISGTPEIGGLTSIQALELIRGCKGLNVIGADVVEVSYWLTTLMKKYPILPW